MRADRAARAPVDPWRPLGWLAEEERTPEGRVVPTRTVFLAGAECPFSCVFCDLWRYTIVGATPPGALTRQLELALIEMGPVEPGTTSIKLYNASNFFEPRAVPEGEEGRLLPLLSPFFRVVVENHPRLASQRCLAFAEALDGRLEVAMGLETVHPEALPRLGKSMHLADFDAACRRLRGAGVSLRAFVLVGAPFVPAAETVDWAVRSAEHAFAQGVGTVTLIPVRGGGSHLARLEAEGRFTPPRLGQLEEALERCLALGGGVAQADLWDLERFAVCAACSPARRERLHRQNLSGQVEPAVTCEACAG
ncbi:MAG TPA: radical SAM protein [Thermoanaerobaculia bacterium]|nr:radical SAM protein [Thermoanaerobaculia bacterium]